MRHNLFSNPTQINVFFEENKIKFKQIIKSQSISDILDDIDYNTFEIKNIFKNSLDEDTYNIVQSYINENSYLKTTWS